MTPLDDLLEEAEAKAWDSLARYKFAMFGYWANIWVHINRAGGFNRPSPFTGVVRFARLERRLKKGGRACSPTCRW